MPETKERHGRFNNERPTPVQHLSQVALARRWNLSPRTLEGWRSRKKGPRYIKLGHHIVYTEDDIEAYESTQARG